MKSLRIPGSEAFLTLLAELRQALLHSLLSVKPFANIVTDYTCRDGNDILK